MSGFGPIFSFFVFSCGALAAEEIIVRDAQQLRQVLGRLKDGDVLRIAPGEYPGGNHVVGVKGLKVQALDPAQPPMFKGGQVGWHFSRCPGLHFSHVKVSGQSDNGINLDDGGAEKPLVTGIVVEHVEVTEIGPKGNHDAVKCSGLTGATIQDCRIEGWGGQGIDFVGCHDSVIRRCHFVGREGFSATAAVQLKGGTSNVVVEHCMFDDAGQRPVNAGGSTGLPFFRPLGAKYEARDLVLRHNEIRGSQCAVAFVGVDGAVFEHNTVIDPSHYIIRILQETKEEGFVPCRNVVVQNNRFTFRRGGLRGEVNVGEGTAPETFRFLNNHWLAEDDPARSRPRLPVEEVGGKYGLSER